MSLRTRLLCLVAAIGLAGEVLGARTLGRASSHTRSALRSRNPARTATRMTDVNSAISSAVDAFSSRFGADATAAAAAAADAAPAEVGDPNLFDQYVNLIRELIVSLHDNLAGMGMPYAYALSIFLFTVCVKLLVLPLNWKQMEGTVAMQKLQPRTQKLTKWFGENPQALSLETQELYKNNNVNPLAGCLPSLAQIPVFIGLYRAITGLSHDNVLSESFLWIPTLEGPVADYGKGMGWLTENWVDGHPSLGWHDTLCYLSLPVILVLSQAVSMRVLTPPTQDDSPQAQQTQQIMKFLPLMIGWFALSAPAGLGLYWFFNNIITTAQSIFIKTMLGMPLGGMPAEKKEDEY